MVSLIIAGAASLLEVLMEIGATGSIVDGILTAAVEAGELIVESSPALADWAADGIATRVLAEGPILEIEESIRNVGQGIKTGAQIGKVAKQGYDYFTEDPEEE